MYLKSVELQGFKSFADKIYLDFNPGITAIVGPNGSGKSNISDAIRWVMGEQSIKSLRGSRMEDVIFSGTEVRKPQGFAEVSLVIDNSERMFPLDYEEVTVTRRVYRSGEGEYFINRNACRLKDIHELFMDTGLGREGYSIVGQGKIDEILSNKSEDRRRIFEEAAGITKYKYRKNEAERKLERTNENLTRVADIMTELGGQLEPLKNQSEKAKKYLNLRDELKGIEVNASVVSIEKYRNDLKKAEKEYTDICESIASMQKETEETENTINALYSKIEEYDAETVKLRSEKEQAAEKTADGTNSINLAVANIGHINENIERINSEIQKCERGMEQLDALFYERNKVVKSLRAERDTVSKEKEGLEKELDLQNTFFATESQKVEELRSEIIEKTSEINSVQSKIDNYNILIENFKAENENAEAELEKQGNDYERLSRNNEELKNKLDEFVNKLKKTQAEASEINEAYKKATQKAGEISEIRGQMQTQLNQLISKKNILEDLENDFEGYSRSVKAVMTAYNQKKLKDCKIFGPVSTLINTDNRYVTAIETALMSVGQNIVTENENDAKIAIEYLKTNKLGRATFMPVSTIKTRTADIEQAKKMQGYIAVAKDLVECDKHFDELIGNILGATVVADNIDNAICMAAKCGHKFKIVTLDGDVMQVGGSMSGGSTTKNSGFLSRKSEIEELARSINTLNAKLEDIEKQKVQNTDNLNNITEEAERVRSVLMSENEEYAKLKAETEHSDRYLAEAKQRRDSILSNMEISSSRINEINEDIEESRLKIEALNSEIVKIKNEAEDKAVINEKILENLQGIQDKILSITIEENAKSKDVEINEERLESVLADKRNVEAEIKEKLWQIDEFNKKIEEINTEIEENRKKLDSVAAMTIDYDKRIEEISGLRKSADSKTRQLQDSIKGTRDSLFDLGQQKVKTEAKKSKIETDLDGIFTHLWDEYELTYTEALKIRSTEEINLIEANREIASLKSKIKALGNINIDAIEEYKNVKERFDFLTEQTNDLQKAKGELEGLISDMIEIMKKQFSEQFAVISKNFNTVFRELFGGGQASVSLADPDDVLESGVEIEAQPPGKKLQNLTLLSGGEKAFTAIALLFAILKVRPTPFCILDEIEAALDDVNVYRYADYLKKYSKSTQFIVVTHRRGTMEAANILYGVTMQEKGISKLLALNIDEVVE